MARKKTDPAPNYDRIRLEQARTAAEAAAAQDDNRPPVNDEVLNIPVNHGLKAAVRNHAARSGDSGMAQVIRRALCLYLNVDLSGDPRSVPLIPAPPAGDDGERW